MTERRYEPADLVKPEVIADPYPAYEALRADSPVAGYADYPPGTIPGLDEPTPAWALLTHEHVLAAARDHKTFSSANFQRDTNAPTLMLVNHDEPEHSRLRRLVSRAFTPRRVRELKPWVDDMVKRLLDALPEGEIDAVGRIASEIPPRVMLHLLGLPQGDAQSFKRWANAFMLSAPMTPEDRMASNVEMMEYFSSRVRARKNALDGGTPSEEHLIDALLLAKDDDGGRLSSEEVTRFCFTLVVAGSETTMYLGANVFRMLVEHPDLFPVLQNDRSKVKAFLDETLRLSGPPQRLFRKVTRDVEIGGKRIREGEWVALFFAAANHDPVVFPDPGAFRLDRSNAADHLTYGLGIHYCLGGPLASLEVECMTQALLDRYEGIERGSRPPVPQTATLLQHSWTEIPVVLRKKDDAATEARNLAATQSLFACFGARDVDGILAFLQDDVTIEFYGPATIPYAGIYRGKAEARRFFTTVHASLDIQQFDAEEMIAKGDKVFVTGHLTLTPKTTGISYESDFAHVITLRDGKWLRFRDFMNTAVAADAFSGRGPS